MANLINSKTSSALCLVAQHPIIMFIQDFLVKLERVCLGQDIVQDILVILNVGKEKNGDTIGLHLKVVMVDVIGLYSFFM